MAENELRADLSVLCVDDDVSWRRVFKNHFEWNLTPNVDLAEDYSSALRQIKQKKYDLIILDSLEGDCFKLYDDVAEIPHGQIIMFTGNDDVRKLAKERGIPCNSKTNSYDKLAEIVSQYKPLIDNTRLDNNLTQ